VRWLSKGKVLERVIFLRVEIVSFFDSKDTDRFNFLHDDIWWLEVSFLNDFFNKLNILNLSLQTEENIITTTGKLKPFEKKLQFWIKKKSKDLKFDFLPSVKYQPSKQRITRNPNHFQKSALIVLQILSISELYTRQMGDPDQPLNKLC
jgi:hypothetical protein